LQQHQPARQRGPAGDAGGIGAPPDRYWLIVLGRAGRRLASGMRLG